MKKIFLFTVFFVFSVLCLYGQEDKTIINLSTDKFMMGSTELKSQVYFAGGITSEGRTTDIAIYDLVTGKWSHANLSISKNFTSAVSVGNKVLFAGGLLNDSGTTSRSVDIFDTYTHQWIGAQLSQPRFAISAGSDGKKALFAGGGDFLMETEYDVVDIYDAEINQWTKASLSEPRGGMGAAVLGNLAFFAGGYSFSAKRVTDKVDIYNFSNDSWSTMTLSEPRCFIGAVAVGNKVLFAGGSDEFGVPSKRVDIYDASIDSWSIDSLSVARAFMTDENVASVCGKAYFIGGMTIETQNYRFTSDFDVIDIYDDEFGVWTFENLPSNLYGHSTISVGNHLLVAGGSTMTEDVNQLHREMSIFTCTPAIEVDYQLTEAAFFNIFPNPAITDFTIAFTGNTGEVSVIITDLSGNIVYTNIAYDTQNINVNTNDFMEGIYVVKLKSENFTASQRVIVNKRKNMVY